mmetsp:Transcript_33271/g.65999  ORF Transcript_33271/g.65999 Transcript_33271/m.65999 type:complete len:124 (-) Transcript_33271:230-601(-)
MLNVRSFLVGPAWVRRGWKGSSNCAERLSDLPVGNGHLPYFLFASPIALQPNVQSGKRELNAIDKKVTEKRGHDEKESEEVRTAERGRRRRPMTRKDVDWVLQNSFNFCVLSVFLSLFDFSSG